MTLVRTFEVLPGALFARVYKHEISSTHGKIACWSFVSDGLHRQRHPEVVVTLRRRKDEDDLTFPEDALHLFGALYQGAERGERAAVGGCTEFRGDRLFDHHLLYGDAQQLEDVPVPVGALAAILVNDEELRAARAFGPTRVLARLGQAEAHYPFPTWNERGRKGVVFKSSFEQSVLGKITVRISGMFTVLMQDQRVTLRVQRTLAPQWRDAMLKLPDAPFAMLPLRDPKANACLVWVPGQREASAIAPVGSDGTRVTGGCLIFGGEQTACGGKLIEDGFAIALVPSKFRELRTALAEGTPLTIASTDGTMDFALVWEDELYPVPAFQATTATS